MTQRRIDSTELHEAFRRSPRKHVLMITNHGIHQWQIVPGLPDTGGQNVFVNLFTQELAEQGYKVTIINRGGYKHPQTGELRTGLSYKDENQRIFYVEDGRKEFVRKEDMNEQIEALTDDLWSFYQEDGGDISFICSHYWDAAKIGILFNRRLPKRIPHVWVPHSLGTIKKRNMPEAQWPSLRVDERISIEREMISGKELDGVVATSSLVRQAFAEDYGRDTELFLPPCIDTKRYAPRQIAADDSIWDFVQQHCGLSKDEIRSAKIVTEISRTDRTKRKDIVIRAFAEALKSCPTALLLISFDKNNPALAAELEALVDELGVRKRTAIVGSVWEYLPRLYAITSVYCTPSEMEGFGMSIQEAAATRAPAVASNLVPFAVEYLLGKKTAAYSANGKLAKPITVGEGGIVVEAGDVAGFAAALTLLLTDEQKRADMAQGAYRITIPYFTWNHLVTGLLKETGIR